MTQTIPLDTRLAGRMRDQLMPADLPIPCTSEANQALFADVIDRAANVAQGNSEGKTRAFEYVVRAAKNVCASCPVQLLCLEHHGTDYELGVVGGLTDGERAELFGTGA